MLVRFARLLPGGGWWIQVQLNELKAPVGHNILEFQYPSDPPTGVSAAQYIQQVKTEIKRACQLRNAELADNPVADGTPLPVEGQTL